MEVYGHSGGLCNPYYHSPLPTLLFIVIGKHLFHDLMWVNYTSGALVRLLQASLNGLYICNATLSPMCTATICTCTAPNIGTDTDTVASRDTKVGTGAKKQQLQNSLSSFADLF